MRYTMEDALSKISDKRAMDANTYNQMLGREQIERNKFESDRKYGLNKEQVELAKQKYLDEKARYEAEQVVGEEPFMGFEDFLQILTGGAMALGGAALMTNPATAAAGIPLIAGGAQTALGGIGRKKYKTRGGQEFTD